MDKELVRRDIEMMITDQLFEARYGNRQHLGTPKINGKPEGFPEDGQYRNLRRHHPDRGFGERRYIVALNAGDCALLGAA